MKKPAILTAYKRRTKGARRLRLFSLVIMLAVLIITQTGCSSDSAAEPVQKDNYYLDTICTISVYEIKDADGQTKPAAELEDAANAAIDKAFERCAALDKTLSRTVEVSDVSKINSAGGKWVDVSPETAEVIRKGIDYSQLSEGAFDITVGRLTELWDFHADDGEAKLPDEAELADGAKHVDYNALEIDGNRIRLKDPEAKLDLGGIAKGFIGDKMTEVLEAEGVTSGIINLGGNVICIGAKDNSAGDGKGDFIIGVETPFSDRSEIVGKIASRDMTLVTSGIYERKIEVDGKLYHHILSTETGWPVDTDVVSVTLCAAKGRSVDLDALSTICLIKGSAEAGKLIEGMDGIEAFFVLSDGSTEQTSGMEIEAVK